MNTEVALAKRQEAVPPRAERAEPNVSEAQVRWLAERMGLMTDAEACARAFVDEDVLEEWLADPEFAQVYELALTNKREGFKYLISQLNGKALRVIIGLLDDNSVKARTQGLQLLLRAQGLLIDKQERIDPDSLMRLVEALRQPVPVSPVDRILPPKAGS